MISETECKDLLREYKNIINQIRMLKKAGMGEWIEPCLALLQQLDGLEAYVDDPGDAPIPAIHHAITAAIAADDEEVLLDNLSQLYAFEYQFHDLNKVRWNPLDEPLEQFFAQHKGVSSWQSWNKNPKPAEVRVWLKNLLDQ